MRLCNGPEQSQVSRVRISAYRGLHAHSGSVIEQWDQEPLSFQSLSAKRYAAPIARHSTVLSGASLEAASSASELSQLKDYLSKLKFNYLELETKRLFLQQLRTNGPPSRHAVQHTGTRCVPRRRRVTCRQRSRWRRARRSSRISRQRTRSSPTISPHLSIPSLTVALSLFHRRMPRLISTQGTPSLRRTRRPSSRNSKSSSSSYVPPLRLHYRIAHASQQEARAASLEQAPVPRHITQQLNNYKTANHAMLSLCGFDVHDVSPNVMRVTLRFEDAAVPTTSLTFTFVHNTQQLSDATVRAMHTNVTCASLTVIQLSPPLVSFEDLLEEALRANVRNEVFAHPRLIRSHRTPRSSSARLTLALSMHLRTLRRLLHRRRLTPLTAQRRRLQRCILSTPSLRRLTRSPHALVPLR